MQFSHFLLLGILTYTKGDSNAPNESYEYEDDLVHSESLLEDVPEEISPGSDEYTTSLQLDEDARRRYRYIGCWRDTGRRAVPTIEGTDNVNLIGRYWTRRNPLEKCYQATKSRGYRYFAVQNGGWCATSFTAGTTYKKYGPSTACKKDGEGGPWANAIYEIKDLEYTPVGCYADRRIRAIPVRYLNYRRDPIRSCYKYAKTHGYQYFAVQHKIECFSTKNAGNTYKRYGRSRRCRNGRGGTWANDVYKIKSQIQLKTPVVSCQANGSRIAFKCQITPTGRVAMYYEVKWYLRPIGNNAAKLIKTETLSGANNASFIQNSDHVRLFRLGGNIYTKVRAWLANNPNEKSGYVSSNIYFAGFRFDRSSFNLLESGTAMQVKVTATVPIICEGGTRNCSITVRLVQSNTAVMISKCTLVFAATSRVFSVQTFQILAKRDFVDDGSSNMTISQNIVSSPGASTNGDWSGIYGGAHISVSTTSVSTGRCTSSGDPHIRTFDGQYFNHYRLGDYTLVDSKVRKFQVQARTHRCASVACNCGVAVREGDDVLVVDMCRGFMAPQTRYASKQEPQRGTYISRSQNGRTFLLKFRSGASVKFVAKKWFGRNYYADVTVQIPADDYGKTRGLCGIIDKNKRNDMTAKNGKVFHRSCGRQACPEFTESWKLSRTESLFYYNSGEMKCLPKTRSSYCQCMINRDGKTNVDCNIQFKTPTFQAKIQAGYTKILFPGQAKCDKERRVTTDVTAIVLTIGGPDEIYTYKPPKVIPVIPSFPTKSGITKTQANHICKGTIKGSKLFKACREAIGLKFTIQGFLAQCVTDIEILDNKATAVTAAMDAMKSDCEEVIMRDPTTWKPGPNGKPEPPTAVSDEICPNQCSKNGKCVKGKCVCIAGFLTEDCSVKKGVTPSILKISNDGLCDVRKQKCSTIKVIADNLVPGDIQCAFFKKAFSKSAYVKQGAVLLSFAEVYCLLPKTRYHVVIDQYLTTKVGNPVNTYHVSVANGNGKFSSPRKYFKVYDSKCMRCTNPKKICYLKKNTCKVNGFCFRDGEADPRDPKCKVCDSASNKYLFVYRKNKPAGCKVHPCDERNNGGCSQMCKKKMDKYECACKSGFTLGQDGKSCNKGAVSPFHVTIRVIQGYPTYPRVYTNMYYGYGPFMGYPNFFNALPGSLNGFTGAGVRSRVYVQLKLQSGKQHIKFVPRSCIATPTPNRFSPLRYEIIRNGKPVDPTFIQHTAVRNVYRFSVSPFNMAGVPHAYIHCKSVVTCKCQGKLTSVRDDVYNDDSIDDSNDDLSYYTIDSTARVEIAESLKNIDKMPLDNKER